jgi:hypothetical protein
MFEHVPRVALSRRAYSVPNRSVQSRIASCETSNPSGEHQFGYVAQAHAEAVIEPHATTTDLRREARALVERGSGPRLGHGASKQTARVLAMPVWRA